MSLVWIVGDGHYQITQCGRFTVAKCITPAGARYVAYDVTKETLTRGAKRLGVRERPSAAKALCAAQAQIYDSTRESNHGDEDLSRLQKTESA
jgi:hypothetical protein